jgi:amino acid transporter
VEKGKIGTLTGLPGLSLDALTSVAYGPEAIVVVLAAAGAGAIGYVRPITVAVVVLLAILVFSYRQVIAAYPDGGGAYAVSKENLGTTSSLLAGASSLPIMSSPSRSQSPLGWPRWPRPSQA